MPWPSEGESAGCCRVQPSGPPTGDWCLRVTAWSGLEGTLGDDRVQPPQPKQVHLEQGAQECIQMGLEYLHPRLPRLLLTPPPPRTRCGARGAAPRLLPSLPFSLIFSFPLQKAPVLLAETVFSSKLRWSPDQQGTSEPCPQRAPPAHRTAAQPVPPPGGCRLSQPQLQALAPLPPPRSASLFCPRGGNTSGSSNSPSSCCGANQPCLRCLRCLVAMGSLEGGRVGGSKIFI